LEFFKQNCASWISLTANIGYRIRLAENKGHIRQYLERDKFAVKNVLNKSLMLVAFFTGTSQWRKGTFLNNFILKLYEIIYFILPYRDECFTNVQQDAHCCVIVGM
jgi:hypothetical protein